MSDKTALLRDEDEAFAELQQAIDGLRDGELGQVWLGTWGVREILIHISGWHEEMASALERLARGETPFAPGTYDDYDGWNARFVERRAGIDRAGVMKELTAARQAFIDAAARVPDAQFAAGGSAREPFEGAGAGHYREHAAQIRDWRKTLP